MQQRFAKLVTNGLYREALSLYTQHHSASLPPHKFTFPPLLKACTKLKSKSQGQILHTHIIKYGFLIDVYTATALTDMYMKLNLMTDAFKLFDEMPNRNVASLNVVVSGFSQTGYCREAFTVFKEALGSGFRPNSVTIASLFSASEYVVHGMSVHCLAMKLGVEMDVYVGTSLVTMYANFQELVMAKMVFDHLPIKNVVSYNAFFTGLLQNGAPRLLLDVFKDMIEGSGEKPNIVTLVSIISACASLLYLSLGRQVHGSVQKSEMQFDCKVGTALVDMYWKCSSWKCAYDVFNELNGSRNLITWNSMLAGLMSNDQSVLAMELFEQLESEGLEPDSATWNSMISGFSKSGKGIEAFEFFKRMQSAGVLPSLKCITSLLPACSDLSVLKTGKEIHGYCTKADATTDIYISTSLIDMYMKCGVSSLARIIFDQFNVKPKDPAFWNAMISGYGKNGEHESALEIFDKMQEDNIRPNAATFVGVLSVCSHTGQVDKGSHFFKMMHRIYDLKPNSEHYGCIVDLLGRYGRLDEAQELIEETPEPSVSFFSSLLGACRSHLNPELGEVIAMKISELEPENPTPFVILSSIYADLGRWTDAERLRNLINSKRLVKHPAHSLAGVT